MDSYQAIYDAVRSRISNGDIGHVIERVAMNAFDLGHTRALLQQEFVSAAYEMQRPSVLFKPTIAADGDMWFALLGEDLQTGVSGFGETPSAAMTAFDLAFWKGRTPAATLSVDDDAGHCTAITPGDSGTDQKGHLP